VTLPRRVVLASGNKGKLREMAAILAPLGLEVRALAEFTDESPVEDGQSFVENAIIKARHAARVSGLPAIADDSGLEVDALEGDPGIRSARFAGEQADDQANNRKLLEQLHDVPELARGARYRCAMVYMRTDKDPSPVVCQAGWEGRIATRPSGTGGFGYDPLFLPQGIDGTAAELAPERKNELSHRGKALRALVAALADLAAAP
jgi:XTP/dITP diphosphohydrolase